MSKKVNKTTKPVPIKEAWKRSMMNRKKILGRRIRIVTGKEYLGYYGRIEYCGNCCRAHRIQFEGIGNNVRYSTYKAKLIFV